MIQFENVNIIMVLFSLTLRLLRSNGLDGFLWISYNFFINFILIWRKS